MKDLKPDEEKAFWSAFDASTAKTVKERHAAGMQAIEEYRKNGMKRAVDQGVKDGTLSERAKARRRRIDKAIDG